MHKQMWVVQRAAFDEGDRTPLCSMCKQILLALWRISVACCWTRSLLPSSSYSVSLSCITQISPSWMASSSCLCRFCRTHDHTYSNVMLLLQPSACGRNNRKPLDLMLMFAYKTRCLSAEWNNSNCSACFLLNIRYLDLIPDQGRGMYCGALNCPTSHRPWWFSQHWPKTSAVCWSCLGSLWPPLEPSEVHSSVLTVSAARPLPELGTLYEARPAGKHMFTKMCSRLDQAQNNIEGLKKKEQKKND